MFFFLFLYMLTRKLTKIIGYGALYANSYYCGMKGGDEEWGCGWGGGGVSARGGVIPEMEI
jgi:hypothetical protein